MSKSYRELKHTVASLQAMLIEANNKLTAAKLEAGHNKALESLHRGYRQSMYDLYCEKCRILSDYIEENRRLKNELKKFGYTFSFCGLADTRKQERLEKQGAYHV